MKHYKERTGQESPIIAPAQPATTCPENVVPIPSTSQNTIPTLLAAEGVVPSVSTSPKSMKQAVKNFWCGQHDRKPGVHQKI